MATSGHAVGVLGDKSGNFRNAVAVEGASAKCFTLAVHAIAVVLQWEAQHNWATVAEFERSKRYAVKWHGGWALCGLQIKGLFANYFMGKQSEAVVTPYVYTARYNGTRWQLCLREMGNRSAEGSALGSAAWRNRGEQRVAYRRLGSWLGPLHARSHERLAERVHCPASGKARGGTPSYQDGIARLCTHVMR